jgi:hypothetical protein
MFSVFGVGIWVASPQSDDTDSNLKFLQTLRHVATGVFNSLRFAKFFQQCYEILAEYI